MRRALGRWLSALRDGGRVQWRSLAVLAALLALAFVLIRLGIAQPPASFEGGLCLTLAGAVLAAFGKTLIDAINRGESYRQGAYTVRAEAVQRVCRAARECRELFLAAWAQTRPNRWPPEADEPEYLDELDRRLLEMRNAAFDDHVWLGEAGVQAVRDFRDQVTELQLEEFENKDAATGAFNQCFDCLDRELKIGLGFWFD